MRPSGPLALCAAVACAAVMALAVTCERPLSPRRVDSRSERPATVTNPSDSRAPPTPSRTQAPAGVIGLGASQGKPRERAVHGIVLDRGGHPAPGAEILVRIAREHGEEHACTAIAGSDGSFAATVRSSWRESVVLRARDPATGDESEDGTPEFHPHPEAGWLLLRMRPTVVVRGRIVDRDGRPVAGCGGVARVRHEEGESNWSEESLFSSGTDGKFAVRLAHGKSGSVAIFGELGHVQWSDGFDIVGSEVDVGDMLRPGPDRTCEWTLRLVDSHGRPCAAAVLGHAEGQGFSLAAHRDFGGSPPAIRSDAHGLIRVRMSIGSPLLLGIGASEFAVRTVALPGDRPGPREATVTLEPKARLDVRLRGPGAASLSGAGCVGSVETRVASDEPRLMFDAGTGLLVPRPRGVSFAGWDIGSYWQSGVFSERGEWTVWMEPGLDLRIMCRLGETTHVLASAAVESPPAGSSLNVDLEVAAGEVFMIDSGAAADPGGPWPPGLAVWVESGDAPREHVPSADALAAVWSDGVSPMLWVPAEARAVRFGYLAPSGPLGLAPVPGAPGARIPRSDLSGGVLRVPDVPSPPGATGVLEVRVVRGGHAVTQAGIPLTALTMDESRGNMMSTDDQGSARVRLLPGRYAVWFNGGGTADIDKSQREIVDVSPGSASRVTLDLDRAR